MQIYRDIYKQILDWKQQTKGSKSLLLEGARRTGKSTIAAEFGRREYKSYVVVDFSLAGKRIRDSFDDLGNLDLFFQTLSLEYNTRLYPRESLIVFDEIQKFPRAREAVKYLVADGRYDYLETGSLISIKENVKDITIPSEERKLKMYPVTFSEFAVYLGEELLLEYIADCYAKRQPLEQSLHERAMRLIKEYMLVGGMPQAVVAYAQGNRDFEAADAEKRDILNLYRDDIKKAAAKYYSRVSALFENIPGFLSSHSRRVVLNGLDRGATYSEYDDPLFWLSDSMLCNLCYKCNDPNIGFALTKNISSVKCYMADTGLLVSLSFSKREIAQSQLYRQIMDGKLSLNQGMLYENLVAQMLTAQGRELYFYNHYNEEKHRDDIEIDFLLSNESKTDFRIYPVEVKSSKKYSAVSLDRFAEQFAKRMAYSCVIHPRNFTADGNVLKIPPYMISAMQ